MPGFSQIFILKTFNAVGGLVDPLTRSYKFTGGAVVTTDGLHNVTVDVSGASANAWDVFGNAGPGLVLGTTTADSWNFIASGISRGGFEATGEFFLKTHTGYAGSENFKRTMAVATTDAVPTNILVLPVPDLTNNFITVKVQARRDTGADRAAFERRIMYWREGGLVILSPKVHTTFTDKSNVGYNLSFAVSGSNLLVQVTGAVGHNLFWTGNVDYQGVHDNT